MAAAIDGLTRDLAPVLAAAPSFQQQGPQEQMEQQPPPASTTETRHPASGSPAAGSAPQADTSCQQQDLQGGDTSPPHNAASADAVPHVSTAAVTPGGVQLPYTASAAGNMLSVNQALADLLASSEDDDGDAAGGITAAGASRNSGLRQHLARSRSAAAAGVPSQPARQPGSQLLRGLATKQLVTSQDDPRHEARLAAEALPVQQQQHQQQLASTRATSPFRNLRPGSGTTAAPEPRDEQSSPGRKRVAEESAANQQGPGRKRQRKGRPPPLPPMPAAATVPPPTPPSRAQAAAAVFALRCLHAVRDAVCHFSGIQMRLLLRRRC